MNTLNAMADSVYKSVNVSEKQLLFLKKLDDFEIDYFKMESIQDEIGVRFENINEVLENLTDKNLLKRIEKGKYARENFNDQNVIANILVENSAVAYWSALHLHGMTSRFPNTVFVQTTQRKKGKTVFGVSYKFISVAERKFIGITTSGYGNYSFSITDVDKTLVDCFDLPQHSGGFDGLVQAFAIAKLNSQNLIKYCTAINNIAIIKRMGFLAELFQKKGTKGFITWAQKKINPKYNLIDAGGLETGEFIREWRLRLNVSRDDLLNLTTEIY